MANADSVLLRPSLFRTLFFVAIAGVSVVLIDSVLAGTERRETALAAARFDREGQALMGRGQYAAAANAFRSAIANERGNTEYPLALGQALLDAGQLDEAGDTLTDLLEADSMAGAPNLAMARVFAKEGQFEDAAFYYHRAIYGQWKGDAQGYAENNRVKARFELADFLAARNSKAELLAELLPLQEQAPGDYDTQMKLGRLYMTAGAPGRAASLFHDLVREYPRNADVLLGLGGADFAQGNYADAESAYNSVLRLRPGDLVAKKQAELCGEVLDLDPLRRGLDAAERYRRSVLVLQMVVDRVGQCSGVAADLAEAANSALNRQVSGAGQSDAVEANLEVANKLWQAGCAGMSSGGEALGLVLSKDGQSRVSQ